MLLYDWLREILFGSLESLWERGAHSCFGWCSFVHPFEYRERVPWRRETGFTKCKFSFEGRGSTRNPLFLFWPTMYAIRLQKPSTRFWAEDITVRISDCSGSYEKCWPLVTRVFKTPRTMARCPGRRVVRLQLCWTTEEGVFLSLLTLYLGRKIKKRPDGFLDER